jgi:hypothetical protein
MISIKKEWMKRTSPTLRKKLASAGKQAYGIYATGVHNFHENEKKRVVSERKRIKKTGQYFSSNLDF